MSVWSRIANVVRGRSLSREIDEEFQSHIDEAIEQGRDAAEARRAFGSALRHREESRDIRLIPWLDSLRADADLRLAANHEEEGGLRGGDSVAGPGGRGVHLGIPADRRTAGAAVARVSSGTAVQRRFCKGIGVDGRVATYDSCSYPMFRQMRAAVKDQAESVAVSYAERIALTYGRDQELERAYRQYVSGWMFDSFGLHPALGRLLTGNDDIKPGAHPVAVLSHDYWTRRFGGDPRVDRTHIPHRRRPLRNRRRRPGTALPARDRHGHRHLRSHR